jgi:8-oxo-dGTP pyrophosphatase MutT (NUDIX family)
VWQAQVKNAGGPARREGRTARTLIKHATAGAFLFARFEDGWKIGLIAHPRLGRNMIPGGHVEADEQCAQAAVREIAEETGLTVRLLPAPVTVPLPARYPHPAVTTPWWITEIHSVADNHVSHPHVHVDHQYVAIVDDPTPTSTPAHEFRWYTEADVAEIEMFEDTRLLAKALFGCVDELGAGGHEAVFAALSHS